MINVNKEMDGHINDFVEKMKRRERIQKEMIETYSYIGWLEEFCKSHPKFTDSSWVYCPGEISEEDNNKVELLDLFFDAIENFADKNYIPFTPCDHGLSYYIKYNERVYEIGIIIGQGAVCFCNVADDDTKANIIEFEELSKPCGKTLIRSAQIDNQLGRIDDLLRQLKSKDLNIPLYAIEDRVKKVIEQLGKNK